MELRTTAPLNSQLGTEPCPVEDTEEIFWLREEDDFRSKVELGNALAAQYRFRDAVEAYQQALGIREDDRTTHQRLAGACLTLRRFDEALLHYRRCLQLGAKERDIAFPVGVWYYLSGDYETAREWFEKVLPCGDELAIAVIYWHTLCCFRLGREPSLREHFHADMEVGHHRAYALGVSVLLGFTGWQEALEQVAQEKSPLDYVIALYGIGGYLEHIGESTLREQWLERLLARDECWPCIPYLAAWGDRLRHD